MKTNRIGALLSVGGLVAAVSGCATSPMSKSIRAEATAARHVTVAKVLKNPTAYIGTEVIWGGAIVKVVNEPSASKIYLSEIPLDWSGDPIYYPKSSATFVAKTSGTLNPELYQPGRVLTLGGRIAEQETGAADQTASTYPVVTMQEVHFWKLQSRPFLYDGSNYEQYSRTGEFYRSIGQELYYLPDTGLDQQANRSLEQSQDIHQALHR